MKKVIKIVSLILCLVMIASTFIACSKDEAEETDGSEVTTTVADSENLYDENGYLKDSLPEFYDWGKNFTIYSWADMKSWEWCEELTTDSTAIHKLMWDRQRRMEERFGVNLVFEFNPGSWDNKDQFISNLMNSVLSYDGVYDMVGQYTPCAGMGTIYGLYKDLNKVEYLDFEKPWWPTNLVKTATVGDKLYYATGDITATFIRNVHCTYVNLDMYESHRLADSVGGKTIFQLVDEHEWTIENMKRLCIDKVDVAQGYFGLTLASDVTADSYFYGGGFISLENVDGQLSLAKCLTDQSLYDYFDVIQDMFTGTYDDIVVCGSALDTNKTASKAFSQGMALFATESISDSSTYTKAGVKFSVLPMPLLNSDKEQYTTSYSMWVSMFSIPVDAKTPEMSGMIMEGLASDAYRHITDEIYYDHFQMRYNAASEDTARMFDIVSDSVVFDPARALMTEIKVFTKFRSGVNSVEGGWGSIYTGNVETWESSLNTLVTKIKDFTE